MHRNCSDDWNSCNQALYWRAEKKPGGRWLLVRLVLAGAILGASATSFAQSNPFLSSQPGYPKWSPFTGIRWEKERPVVQVQGKWYELVSIHGVKTDDILKKCEQEGWETRKRIAEDLVQILRLMGHKIDKTTDLILKDKDGKVVAIKDVAMTEKNRISMRSAAARQANRFSSSQPGYPNWSAFTGVKWEGNRPHVQINDQWYELVKFQGVTVDEIRKTCEKNGWPFQQRFTEDLVQIVRLMGHKIDKTADLELRDESGKVISLKNVKMTAANLRKVVRSKDRNVILSREDVLSDLETFQKVLEAQFAYLKTNNVDYAAAIRDIAQRCGEETNREWLAGELQRVIAQFIDGHAGVSGGTSHFASGFLPFLIVPSGDRYAAIRSDRSGFVDKDHPYIRAIDGIELERWLKATEKYVAKGSRQYRRRHGLRLLRSIQQFRRELGLDESDTISIELADQDDKAHKSMSLAVADTRPLYGTWPPVQNPQILDGNIGYLRITSMNSKAVSQLQTWLPKFRETDGLIIDVRDNGGGIRTPILELAGYLLSKDDTPRIGNVAKYRLAEQFGEDHLSAARFVYRDDSAKFSDHERAAIRAFNQGFQPEWNPPERQFSDWHYLVLSKAADDPRFDYQKPVVILMDECCFSATDIFLGAFKGWPRVTLIGQPSGGGSARSQSTRLPRSGISIRCASMASFQPNGKLYDTHGIEPDIRVERPPEYYLQGGQDVILEKAISVLKRRDPRRKPAESSNRKRATAD